MFGGDRAVKIFNYDDDDDGDAKAAAVKSPSKQQKSPKHVAQRTMRERAIEELERSIVETVRRDPPPFV